MLTAPPLSRCRCLCCARWVREQCRFLVPNRFEFGYGLSPEIVEVAAADQPAVIVTVDNGVSSTSGVARANESASTSSSPIITCPVRSCPRHWRSSIRTCPEVDFQSSYGRSRRRLLSAVATRALLKLRAGLLLVREPNLADWLDLVALGTVADVVPLDHNNRILVQQGSNVFAPGTVARDSGPVQVAKRDHRKLDAADLGFAVGPRLNAAGRLDDMTIGIRCLLADTEAKRVTWQLRSMS